MWFLDASFFRFARGRCLVASACVLASLSVCLGGVPFGATPCAANPLRRVQPGQGVSPPPDSRQELANLHDAGMQAYNRQDYATAEATFLSGLEKAQLGRAKSQEALFQSALGLVYATTQRFDRAQSAYQRALTLNETLQDRRGIVLCLTGLGG